MVLNACNGKLLYTVADSNYVIMFVLARTVWVRNSLFFAVEGGWFSLIKMSSKLCKPCMLKMCHIWKNGSQLYKFGYTYKKCATLGNVPYLHKMRRTWKKVPHLDKFAALGEMCRTWKNGSQFEKLGHTGNNLPYLENVPHRDKFGCT